MGRTGLFISLLLFFKSKSYYGFDRRLILNTEFDSAFIIFNGPSAFRIHLVITPERPKRDRN